MNRFIGIGRWTKDLDLRYSKAGKEVANGTIAITDNYNKEHTDFLNVVIFGKQALNAAEYTKKGSLIGIEGKVSTRNYENSEGKKIYVTEIVVDSVAFLDSKVNTPKTENKGNGGQSGKPRVDARIDNDPFAHDGTPIDISDDDLPF